MTIRRRAAVAAASTAAALAAALTACGSTSADRAPSGPPPALGGVTVRARMPASILNLPLTTASGARTTLAAYRGKIVMLADFLTLCQDTCPMISANMVQIARTIRTDGLASKVALVEVTVDPQRDTPARLAAYQKLFEGPLPDWTLVQASPSGTAALQKFFHFYYQRTPEDDPPGIDWMTGKPLTYDVDHSNSVFFVTADGVERYALDADPDTNGKLLPPTLMHFLDQQGVNNLYRPTPGDTWTVPQAFQVLDWLSGRNIPQGAVSG